MVNFAINPGVGYRWMSALTDDELTQAMFHQDTAIALLAKRIYDERHADDPQPKEPAHCAEASETADLATISQNIIALKANIAAGGSVSQSDLDALDVQVNQVGTGIGTIVTNLDTAAQSDQ